VPRLALELKRSVQLAHAFSHIDQPWPSGFPAFVGIKTDAMNQAASSLFRGAFLSARAG
jgi:hypothetical protein